MENLNLIMVFLEGILSFLSPCILPILPIYLSLLSNSSINDLNNSSFGKSNLLKNTFFFTVGISATFFILGSTVNQLSSFFSNNRYLIMIIGGIVIILMGLFYMDIIKSNFLNKERRFKLKSKEMNAFTSLLLGFTFSFGWTPCIGPILASVLIISSTTDNMYTSYILIGVYTLGFILPFLLVSLFYKQLFNKINNLKNHMGLIKKIGGIILIISGILMLISGVNGKFISDSLNKNEQIENNEQTENIKIKARDFTLFDQYGKEHKLSDYEGKIVFLNFWATWCSPCRSEMPEIETLYKELSENNDDVVVLGVASPNLGKEGSQEKIETFLKDNGYTFPVVFDTNGSLSFTYSINAIPATMIIDKEGYIVQYVNGAMSKETMKLLINTAR